MPAALTTPPSGWIVSGDNIELRNISSMREDSLVEAYKALAEWAVAAKVELTPYLYRIINYTEWSQVYVWTTFKFVQKKGLKTERETNNKKLLGAFECISCSTSLQTGKLFCSECGFVAVCTNCRIGGIKVFGLEGDTNAYCAKCCKACSNKGCGVLVAPNAENITECTKCSPRKRCTYCAVTHPSKNVKEHSVNGRNYSLCLSCFDRYVCQKCSSVSGSNLTSHEGKKLCSVCMEAIYDKQREKLEKWDKEEMPISGSLVLPSSSARPIRTISIETEFNGSQDKVAKALYKAGLIPHPHRDNYSTQGAGRGRHPCLLKSDSSVTGGELVAYLLDLDNENHAAALLRMTEVMRGCREIGAAQFSKNAGGHIHVDLHGFSIGELWSYYTIFKYLEMPIYYLGGAGADYGHRSLASNNYAMPPRGGPWGTKKNFAMKVGSTGRAGLNLSNFVYAVQNCACGARVTGEWADCTCNLGKATAEWRVWNSEIVPRILHAWLATMSSVTAWSQENEVTSESAYPYLEWLRCPFTSLAAAQKDQIKIRLEWMHRELPLTPAERDSIVYACKKSQLVGLGESYLDGLLRIESNNVFASKKKPRNPASRTGTSFQLQQQTETAEYTPEDLEELDDLAYEEEL